MITSDLPGYDEEGIKRLYLAVVLRAIEDLQKYPHDKALQEWLLTNGLFILETYEQPVILPAWKDFVLAGCPGTFHMARK